MALPPVVVVVLAVMMVLAPGGSGSAFWSQAATPGATPAGGGASEPYAESVILYRAEALRPDFVERWIADGALPTFAELQATGVTGENGMTPAFPAAGDVGTQTLATGTYPGEHGIVSGNFHRPGDLFGNRSFGDDGSLLQADTIAQAAERAGQTVVAIEWTGAATYDPPLTGPVIEGFDAFSEAGVVVSDDRSATGEGAQGVELVPAEGWTNVPESEREAFEAEFGVTSAAPEANPDRTFLIYVYDGTADGQVNYDRVLVTPAEGEAARDGGQAVADVALGEWADVKVTLTGEREGETAGFYLTPTELAADGRSLSLYHTAIARVRASYTGCDATATCAADFGETLASELPTAVFMDYGPLEAGLIDEETFVAQGALWEAAHTAYLSYIVTDLGVAPDLLLLGTPVASRISHQFLGAITETVQGQPNPGYDDLDGDGQPDGRVEARTEYVREAYVLADRFLGTAQDLVSGASGAEPTTFALSDQGFAPVFRSVNAGKVLADAALIPAEQTGNCLPPTLAATATPAAATGEGEADPSGVPLKVCTNGGVALVYVNLADRDPAGVVTEDQYEGLVTQVAAAFEALSDPDYPQFQVVADVFTQGELRDVQGSDSLHPSRSADVTIVLNPPYQFTGAAPGEIFARSVFSGQYGYLPDSVEPGSVNTHGLFIAGGPGIAQVAEPLTGLRAVDVAPTVAFLLGIAGPQNARGAIRYDLIEGGDQLRELTILQVSDFHGQLTPLTATSDSFESEDAVSQSHGAGGVAFLDYWFDLYRGEAPGMVLTLAGGDSIGATPPISAYFGDIPTIEFMNRLGFTYDGVGNHNFDVSAEYFTGTIMPQAEFEYLTVNVLDEDGNTVGNAPSDIITIDGVPVALVGFSNDDIPLLTRPGALGPYTVHDPIPLVTEEAQRLRSEHDVAAVIAFGHYGATAMTEEGPTGPLINLADNVQGVDVVLGDHTDMTVNVVRDNGVLVTENRSKGIQFARVRIVVNTATQELVYTTADQHIPWVAGIEPDPEIQGRLDELNEQLQPILATPIGTATGPIPRADSCGNEAGRTCESLVGNVVTDAMRAAYEGVDFAFVNSGGLRADLTCPPEDNPDDFCPPDAPANAITRGTVLGVLPFGNVVSTAEMTGEEVLAFLEHSVSAMPEVVGAFAQVSGLCFTYDIAAAPGSRVTSVVYQNDDGTCSTEAVDLSASATYLVALPDFVAAGGDGYPDVSARATSREPLDTVTSDYIGEQSEISPTIQGRIVCEGSACPVPVQ